MDCAAGGGREGTTDGGAIEPPCARHSSTEHMGIKALMRFLHDNADRAITERPFESYSGTTVAIDASMSLYQFLAAIRSTTDERYSNLTNDAGEVTSHISGFLSRTIRLFEAGVRPVFVFDGKPPDIKRNELDTRADKKAQAEKDLAAAVEVGDEDAIRKASVCSHALSLSRARSLSDSQTPCPGRYRYPNCVRHWQPSLVVGAHGPRNKEDERRCEAAAAHDGLPGRGRPVGGGGDVCSAGPVRPRGLCGHRRARSHCRFVPPLIHFIPDSLIYSVPLFLKRQCDRT